MMKAEIRTNPSGSQTPLPEALSRTEKWKHLVKVAGGFIPMFLVLQYGANLLLPRLGQTWSTVITAITMIVLAFVLEVALFNHPPLQALRLLGYGRPRGRAVVVSLILVGIMLLYFPVLSIISGLPLRLNNDWGWILFSIIVFNGFAEETLFRGFVFGNLRRINSFRRAGLISLVLFVFAHLFLFASNPFVIAFAGTLVALTASFPMAYLFERGRGTLIAPVIIHVGTHLIRLVTLPEALYMPAVLAWLVLQIGMPLLIFAFQGYLKDKSSPQPADLQPVHGR